MQDPEYGLCECGCGEKTEPCPYTVRKIGWIKGEPKRFVHGHQSRKRKGTEYVVDPETGCWVWQWVKNKKGYGQMRDGNSPTMLYSHRVFYERAKGAVPQGMMLDHLCRNPACVNPDHLEPVTNFENIRRGRTPKLSEEAVREIRDAPRYYGYARDLAEKFGVSPATIYGVRRGKGWANVN